MFADDGVVPNNPVLPVVVMAAAIKPDSREIAARYRSHGWGGIWEWTVFNYLHYHPNAHEVLTCARGWGDIRIGGDMGRDFRLTPGDSVVLPAGTGHQLVSADTEFCVVGAYPEGQESPETTEATRENYPGAAERVAHVKLPKTCPLMGETGPTMQAWASE